MPDRFPDRGPLPVLRDRDAGEIIRAAFAYVRAEARPLFAAVFAISAPMFLLSGVVAAVASPADVADPMASSGAVLVSNLLSAVAGLLASSAVFGYALRVMRGETAPTVGEVWEEAKGIIGPLVAFGFFSALLLLLALLPVLIVVGVTASVSPGAAGAIGVLLGVGLLIGMVVFVAPAYVAARAAVLIEGERTLDAWREGFRLAAAGRGTAIGTLLIAGGLFLVLAFIAGAVLGGLALFGSGDPLHPTRGGGLLIGIATALSSLAILPAAIVFDLVTLVLFGSLVARADGTGLDDGLAALEAPDEDALVSDLREAVEPSRPDEPAGASRGFRGGGL